MRGRKLSPEVLEQIRELRSKDVVQDEVARILGIGKSTVSAAMTAMGLPRLPRRVPPVVRAPKVPTMEVRGASRPFDRTPGGDGNAGVGALTEATLCVELLRLGIQVAVPWAGSCPYDLVAHLPDNRFLRVQCKTARIDPKREHILTFNASRLTSVHPRQTIRYTAADIDGFAVWCPATGHTLWVPVNEDLGLSPIFNLDENKRGWQGLRHPEEFPLHHILNAPVA